MGVLVKEGTSFDFSTMKNGETNGREWGYVFVNDTNKDSKKRMIVFIDNIKEAKNWSGTGKIKKISRVEMKARQNKNTGNWEDAYSVTAIVEGHDANGRAQVTNTFSHGVEEEFMEMPADNEDFDNIFK